MDKKYFLTRQCPYMDLDLNHAMIVVLALLTSKSVYLKELSLFQFKNHSLN